MNYETLVRLRTMPPEDLADIALRMADKHPETFLSLIMIESAKTFKVPGTNEAVSFTSAQIAKFRAYGPENKVTLIREIREITRLGLKEAKDLVEAEFKNTQG